MLNGVGGRTVAEARERMTYGEAQDWASYFRARGSINLGLRLEQGFALLATLLMRLHGRDADMADYMPSHDRKEPDINDVMKILMGGR
ncbi:hypothetical protein NNO07_19035 [Pseudomonas resinovorans]|uniref:Minor tail T domain-containing protein n=1 Tax=Metapseudomonas resinovorans TaxID=53412 RepID=A0ABT4Y8G7_METRE|nr:hypothetical protein [Pseudomonas resinovorans]MDA8485167.1 hypothetical protein [Pseudomonas resinovorans]